MFCVDERFSFENAKENGNKEYVSRRVPCGVCRDFFFVRCVTCDLQRDACVWRDAYATCGGMFAAYTFGECDGKAVGLGQSRGRRLLSPVACDACRVMCDMMRVKCDTRDVAGAMWRLA